MDLSAMANSSLAAISRILDSVRSELVASWPTQAVNTPQHDSPYLVKLAFDLIDLHYSVLGNKITLLWVSMIVLAINSFVWVLLPASLKYPQYADKSVQTMSHCAPYEDKVNPNTTYTFTEGIAQAPTPILTQTELPVAKVDSLPMSDLALSASTEQPLQDTALLDLLPESQEPTNLSTSVSHDVPLTLPEIIVHPAPTNEISSPPLVPTPSSTQDTVPQSCVTSETSTSPEPAVVVTESTSAIGDEVPTPAENVEDANNDLGVSTTEAMIEEPVRVSVDDLAAKQPSPATTISVPPRPSDVRVRPRRLILTPIMKPLPSRGVDFVHSTEVIDLTDPKPELEFTPLGDTTNVTIHTLGGPTTRLRAKMRAHTTTRPDWAVAPAAEDVEQTTGPVTKNNRTAGEGKVKSNRAIRRGKKRATIEASENHVAAKSEKTEAASDGIVEVKGKVTRAAGKGRGRGTARA